MQVFVGSSSGGLIQGASAAHGDRLVVALAILKKAESELNWGFFGGLGFRI